MVNVAAHLSPERLSTKALAAAGQFRAIALWLNEPLIPQGIYVRVSPGKRPGCIRVDVEFERVPQQKRLTQYICHLMWQLNSPLIEGIHLTARSIGDSKLLWEQRVRVMTPAIKQRISRERGQESSISVIPPRIATRSQTTPMLAGFNAHLFFTEQLKTLRAFMLTGSAVAAFVFGCMVEVVMSSRPEPSLPFQTQSRSDLLHDARSHPDTSSPKSEAREPQLPEFQTSPQTVTADQTTAMTDDSLAASPVEEVTSVSFKSELERDRPNVINAALEPVGVLKHERLLSPEEPTVTLLFSGDVDLDGLPYAELEHDEQLLSGIPAYQQADLAMVNLQASLSVAATSLEEEFLERQRPEAVNLLKSGGVDVVNLTGEESLSFGEHGLAETLESLDRNGIFRVGAGRSEREARRPEIIDVKGQRIAYLSYDRNFAIAAYDSVGGVNAAEMQDIIQDIQAIRDEVDWLVVNYRWTEEPPETPAESQTNLARLAIDQGADMVVGHHPNQLQGAEIYKGRPIAYSLGDFVFGQSTPETTPETAILQVSLRDRQMKVDLIPVKVKNGQPQKVNGAEADRILNKIQVASQEFQQPMPASVVLETQPVIPGETPHSGDSDSFTDSQEHEAELQQEPTDDAEVVAPVEEPPADVIPEPLISPQDDEVLNPETLETADPEASHESPMDLQDGSPDDLELETYPDDLLNNWGPKESPNTLYEPESLLPHGTPSKEAEAEKTVSPATESATEPVEEAKPMSAPAEPIEVELEVIQPNESISPHSEPLVGPMSHLPNLSPDTTMQSAAIAPTQPRPQAGMPESQVFEPLNTLKPAEEMITIEIKTEVVPSTND
ncbi:CapA family protein [Oscillatoria sp. CS-180]|uniref:CapA family protein n=1 Tax=Oscillatoria sp. CS-180 TaxID=3021720 RepID=UPI0023308711|nr:CapA family protein [Oscillatoria sp. CS-180]MDB9527082.1 CapA family protein [Oscillatoria sp. CS-180]